ncbi:MAG: pyridoxamine 5'-phosphate oxidase [Gammaproteobacteria bacterium]|nr:pyridoxamine 5'-phosphate oxidase [Gammaproteobacteria bacterium]
MDINDHHKEYARSGLSRNELLDEPMKQFEQWFLQAETAGLKYPNAMSLATAGSDGMPSVRTVLLKIYDEQGLIFFTNYGSSKAKQIQENPKAGLLFHWLELERQVKISGAVERISQAESLKYFATRPRGSQLGAWCSDQSQPLSSRQMLETSWQQMKDKFHNKEVPLPDFWGGYRVIPETIEFWQGRTSRLHDRFEYQRSDSGWIIQRLAP